MAWQQPRPWKQPPTARQAPRDQRPITLQGAEGKGVGINASKVPTATLCAARGRDTLLASSRSTAALFPPMSLDGRLAGTEAPRL